MFWQAAKLLRTVVAIREPKLPSWSPSYATLATVLRAYAPRSIHLPLAWQRGAAERFLPPSTYLQRTRLEHTEVAGVPAAWFRHDGGADDAVLYYLHGGGYSIGSIRTHGEMIARLCHAGGTIGFAVDYRLAPEHPFPAQLDDALIGYRHLLASGFDPSRIVIAGESAGGGLTLSTLLALRDAGDPLPAAAIVISPWLDLEMRGASIQQNRPYDYLSLEVLDAYADRFVTQAQRRDPLANPLQADLSGLPPMLIHAGGAEVLADDARRLAGSVDADLVIYEDMIHAFHVFAPILIEGQRAIDDCGAYIRGRMRR